MPWPLLPLLVAAMSAARHPPSPPPDVAVPPPSRLSIVLVTLLFAVLHGWTLLLAISNLVALPGFYELIGIGDAVPWWLLVIGVVAPVLLFTAAVLLGRGAAWRTGCCCSRCRSARRTRSSLSVGALVARFSRRSG